MSIAGLLQIYQSFYCRMNDPSYIKDLKLQLLSAVADDSNAFEIVTELTEYVTDIDEHLAREAVRAVGRIALQVLILLLLPLRIHTSRYNYCCLQHPSLRTPTATVAGHTAVGYSCQASCAGARCVRAAGPAAELPGAGQRLRHSRDAHSDQGPAAAVSPHSRRGHRLRGQHLAAGACCWDTALNQILLAVPTYSTAASDPRACFRWQHVEEPEARAAFIWMLGEHGRDIQVQSPCRACIRLRHAAHRMQNLLQSVQ